MTNLEYYGFKNLEFEEHSYPVTSFVNVVISYVAGHAKRPITLFERVVPGAVANKVKIKWLLKEHEFVKLTNEEKYRYGHIAKGGYSC